MLNSTEDEQFVGAVGRGGFSSKVMFRETFDQVKNYVDVWTSGGRWLQAEALKSRGNMYSLRNVRGVGSDT